MRTARFVITMWMALWATHARAQQADAELAEVAAQILLDDREPSDARVEQLLRASRSTLWSVRAVRVSNALDVSQAQRDLERSLTAQSATVLCGRAQNAAFTVLVCGASWARLSVDAHRVVHVSIDEGEREPFLYVMRADLTADVLASGAELLRSGVKLDASLRGPARLQLVTRGAHGPRPVATLCIGGCPVVPETLAAPVDIIASLSRRTPLRSNALMARAAQEHASDVCRQRLVVHALQDGADPQMRLRRAGLRARVVGETVARSTDESSAINAMLASPSHRFALSDARFTDVGVGVAPAEDGVHVCVVVMLASWPRPSVR